MNWNRIAGEWKQLGGSLKSQWGRLSDDDITTASGERERLVGIVQERYGIAREYAERQVRDWQRSL